MKTKVIFAGMIIAVLAAWTVKAQNLDQPAVKILPAAEQGKLKIVYARESRSNVDVRFITQEGLLKSDRVNGGTFDKGFIKSYDVSRIQERIFWVEVSAYDLTVRYKVVKAGKKFTPLLEQTTYNHPMVAAIN